MHSVLVVRGSLVASAAVVILALASCKAAAQAEPGTFQIDEEDVTRALERALVLEGAQLLPPGVLQIEPDVFYIREEDTAPFLLVEGAGDDAQVLAAERQRERDVVRTSLTLRLGLPYDSQVEVALPYRFEKTSMTVRVDWSDRSATSDRADGLGDIRIGFTKALLRENGQVPSVFGNIFWDTDTGKTGESGTLGSGFNEFGGALTAVRTQDPLVFTGSVFYEHALEDGGIQPGNIFGVSAGVGLAISPETSWRVSLDQRIQLETEAAGSRISGSDRTIGVLSFGVSTLLARGVFLDVTSGIGLTDSAPDYSLSVSAPIRLSSIF